ncbi:hypothetical protein BDA99DRAFT_508942 [Phascolomyces articulosus]|uniref:Uncharacterized protein n=1 Tax=Phascolomyces articulosus TaxID=60185 RepID=A0AAD5PEN1_9FUNG|nr:hypothetical protein BDA99DRAFT_508942 [Phascolomyces articulosus]
MSSFVTSLSPASTTTTSTYTSSSSYSSAFPPLQSIPLTFQQPYQNNPKKHAHHVNHHPSVYQSLAPPKYPAYLKHTLYADLALEQYNYYQSKRSFFPSDPNNPRNNNHHLWNDYSSHTNTSTTTTTTTTALPTTAESASKNQLHGSYASGASSSSASCSQNATFWAEQVDLRLPTCWNQKAKSRHIEIGRNGLDLSYIGPGKSETHAASVKANFPMRRQCGIYYYEMHVISKGDDGYIGIGFCGEENELDRLPGWDVNSYGYHGDDGKSFGGCGKGKAYGPCFSSGDIVGCGVNFAEGTAFFTKNGSFLGNAFEDTILLPDMDYYPCVGLRTPGEHVTVNFGNQPFMFDIVQYIKDCKTRCWKDITGKLPSSSARENKFCKIPRPNKKVYESSERLDQLVLSYLLHHGYVSTAKAVVRDSNHVSGKNLDLKQKNNSPYTKDEKDLEQRHSIRTAILAGNIDHAIELTQKHYPLVLKKQEDNTNNKKGQDIMFELKCRKFIEMMREYSEREDDDRTSVISNTSSNNNFCISNGIPEEDVISRTSTMNDLGITLEEYNNNNSMSRRRSISSTSSAHNNNTMISSNATTPSMRVPGRRRMSYAAIAASASPTNNSNNYLPLLSSPTTEHDEDDLLHGLGGTTTRRHRRLSTRRSSTGSSIMSVNSNTLTEQDLETTEDDEEEQSPVITMKRIMKYGQQLQDEYRHDERFKIRERLVEIFSLLAYPDVTTSPVAHLMHKSGRDELATNLNKAILYHQNKPTMPPLERIYRQAMTVNKELAYAKFGKAIILNVKEHCTSNNNMTQTTSPTTPTSATSFFGNQS